MISLVLRETISVTESVWSHPQSMISIGSDGLLVILFSTERAGSDAGCESETIGVTAGAAAGDDVLRGWAVRGGQRPVRTQPIPTTL